MPHPRPGEEIMNGADFSLSAEQRELTEAAAAFGRELNQDLVKREDAGEFPREAWRRCAKFGVQGLPVPAELGGPGQTSSRRPWSWRPWDTAARTTGSSSPSTRRCGASTAAGDVRYPGAAAGVPARMVSGDLIAAHAMTEPESGSDALHMRTRAERRGDHYLLKGTKQYITNAPVADVLLVYAADPTGPG